MEIDYDRRSQKRKDFIINEFKINGVQLNSLTAVYQMVLFSDEMLKRISNRKFKKLIRAVVESIKIDMATFTGIESLDKGGQDELL